MAGAPPPYPPPYPPQGDWKYQRRVMREQAKAQRDISRDQWKAYRDQQRFQARGARSSSILGPILLIAVGVIFLLLRIGRLDYTDVGIWYGRWWPLLLLAGGIVLLAEWIFDRSRPADHPYANRSRIGGGVIFLLFLLCIPGIILSASHGDIHSLAHGFSINDDNMEEFMGDRHESDQPLDQAFPAGASLSVNNPHGDVYVTGTSQDGQIHVGVHKQVFTSSDSEATDKAARLSPTLTTSGLVMSLNVPNIDGARADLTITLPNTAGTTVTADHGNVHVNTLKAPVTITSNHGDVEVNAIGGSVITHINNRGSSFNARGITGSLTLEGNCRDTDIADVHGAVSLNGDFFGKTHFEHIGSSVRFHTSRTDFQLARLDGEVDITRGDLTADQIQGPVSLSARSYNVTLDRVAGDVSVTTSDGSVDLTAAPPMGNVTIQNRNGEVNVTVPEHANFAVQAETREGDVETDFPLQRSDEDKVSKLTGTVGSGGSLIRINTTQNDISVKKGIVAPLPPPAPPITLSPPAAPESPAPPSSRHSTKPKPPSSEASGPVL